MTLVGLMVALMLGGQATLPRPRTSPSRWITPSDYPAGVENPRSENITRVQLVVARNGLVTECAILQSSGVGDYDRVACRLLRSRARFNPARNAAGRSVVGRIRMTVRWRPPRE
jgi:protein TonB